jgi:hypothetical protein
MSEVVASYKALPVVPKVVVTGILALAALVVLGSVPHLLVPIVVIGAILTGIGIVSLPFLALGLVVYATVRALSPRSHAHPAAVAAATAPIAAPAPAPAAPAEAGLSTPPGADLPPEVGAQVARIHDKVAALRAQEKAAFLGGEDRQHLDQIQGEYLPNALATYRALPTGSNDWQVEPQGETAEQLLAKQLRLLEESLDTIAKRVFEAGAAQLMAQHEFLEQRFRPAPPPSDLDL